MSGVEACFGDPLEILIMQCNAMQKQMAGRRPCLWKCVLS